MDSDQQTQFRFPPKLTKEEINELPLRSYDGPVQVINQDADVQPAVDRLMKEKMIGFDTETKPAFRKGQVFDPSLIQLAGEDMVYLFQINRLSNFDALIPLFEDTKIKKAGVAIERDLKELQVMQEFEPGGFIELSCLSDLIGVESNGLRGLAGLLLNFRISKSSQLSDWSKEELESDQIAYAAMDAYASREMLICICRELKAMRDAGTLDV